VHEDHQNLKCSSGDIIIVSDYLSGSTIFIIHIFLHKSLKPFAHFHQNEISPINQLAIIKFNDGQNGIHNLFVRELEHNFKREVDNCNNSRRLDIFFQMLEYFLVGLQAFNS
jgi:hypothetical protein